VHPTILAHGSMYAAAAHATSGDAAHVTIA
jgi:hypothetical protein